MASETMPDVRLLVDGTLYGGWQSIRIRRGLEQVAGSFELSITERWAGQDTPRPIRPGAACRVLIDGVAVITGFVDDVAIRYDSKDHTVEVSGRDATGDLVDCSAPSTQWKGRTLTDVARSLCAPFKIGVRADIDVGGPFKTLKSSEGDTVFEVLEAAARVRAALLVSDGLGNLVVTRASSKRVSTALELGVNVLSGDGSFSHKDRYSEIAIKGQSAGAEGWSGEAAAQPKAVAKDSRIKRHRPLTIIAEEQIDSAAAKVRAEWERNVRFGRSQRLVYTVDGWRHRDGLWTPNMLVPVRDAFLGITADRLLTGVALILDGEGLRSELTLVPPEAFERVELPEPGAGTEAW
ncbi:phage baseplate assembly protein [Desulfocurvibacter africanus]|uniref:Bacteriophage Mu P n=1 Tax=Desulfocurvibacter africanus subsp. africanus str. Walvis Bay TaxID=690850 RepID=F3YW25_DESAF|nr:hypothetical protein [Desulfocurvibacter africanus]EGJ49055.1 bacteriophage Mu P [Desulfocurvibacter africanus subsp. africanus str. Walvis Bay]